MSFLSKIFGKSPRSEQVHLLTPIEFRNQISSGNVQLVDVRTPLEYRRGHITDAINIDFYSSDFFKQLEKLDKFRPIYLYCRSGVRSRRAAEKLAILEFEEIYDLKGGILNW
ncbi:MAG: rhodanese-like domain-containing protein [Bacteroidia bacterium]|nr:rhodanese-like domain-containing protein [Bacteroidia bacterium]MBT8269577.1 rhodanese-like domain-containing protein [Bacteroidia bacterium]NNK70340.1 rhodanese-like domain-containing protein [Flavobacteriaceae bacterium]NNL80888.1 rhodanese-like domain-containing protein [Flavobacteriaceae bacterium]